MHLFDAYHNSSGGLWYTTRFWLPLCLIIATWHSNSKTVKESLHFKVIAKNCICNRSTLGYKERDSIERAKSNVTIPFHSLPKLNIYEVQTHSWQSFRTPSCSLWGDPSPITIRIFFSFLLFSHEWKTVRNLQNTLSLIIYSENASLAL